MDTIENSLNPQSIDWRSAENYILLNPRWSTIEIRQLQEVARSVSLKRNLQGHLWLATSGSTAESVGFIKLVALSKNAFLTSAKSVNAHLEITSSDVWLQVLPRFHVGGLGVEVRAQLSNSQVICDLAKWNPERIHKIMGDAKVSIASMVPTQVFDLVQARLPSPKNLRAVIVGGGFLNETLYSEARKQGWPLLPSYGMTETCSQIATATLESLKSDKMPLPKKLSHVEWRLRPEGLSQGLPQGLLQVQGPSLLTCYGQRQANGDIQDWDPKEESWLTTEDLVELQGSYLHFLGRKNDFIKIGGEGSSMGRLLEIFDRVLSDLNLTVTQQVLLIDAPSERLGTEIHLVSTLDPAASATQRLLSQLRENFNREVLPFERIREMKYTSHIPRSELGKVLSMQLKRDLYGH